MKWIVGTMAIALFVAVVFIGITVLGEVFFFLVILAGASILIGPIVGELIIDWYEERRFRLKSEEDK